jgi:hypothetical protein
MGKYRLIDKQPNKSCGRLIAAADLNHYSLFQSVIIKSPAYIEVSNCRWNRLIKT